MILSHFVNEWGFKYGRCICFIMCLLKLYLQKQVYYDGNITALRFNMHQMRFEVCRALTYIVKLFFTGQLRKRYCEINVQRMDL